MMNSKNSQVLRRQTGLWLNRR